ncbi:MAG: DUF2127 domain-containing protein [Candidatus Saccharimonadales bacterium]
MSWYHPSSLFDKIFEGGIILKGIDGALEFLGGLLVLFVSPTTLHNFIAFITHRELVEDPHDKISNVLIHATNHYAAGGRTFLVIYLWIHAAIKLIAVFGILKNWLWAYPFSLISLGILMLYQAYTIFFVKASMGMILLTIFDMLILWLIWHEYGKIRQKPADESEA